MSPLPHALRRDFTHFVHEYMDDRGVTRYGVAKWDEKRKLYLRPTGSVTRRLTGVYADLFRDVRQLEGYTCRKKALRRARYLFGCDWLRR